MVLNFLHYCRSSKSVTFLEAINSKNLPFLFTDEGKFKFLTFAEIA